MGMCTLALSRPDLTIASTGKTVEKRELSYTAVRHRCSWKIIQQYLVPTLITPENSLYFLENLLQR